MSTTAALLSKDGLPVPVYVAQLADLLLKKSWHMALAESCTGGLIAAACTERAGASQWFDCGFVSYSNQAKSRMLGVDAALLHTHGAVSEAVARAMAQGAITQSGAQVSLAVTGVAGPDGGTPAKPVGMVCFGWQVCDAVFSETLHFQGDRHSIRQATVVHALHGLLAHLKAVC